MLDHVAIPVRDLETSRKFYEPLFEGLGAKVVMEWPGLALFGTDDGMVALRQSEEVTPMHIAFKADRSGVESFYKTAGRTFTRTTTRLSSSTRTATTSKRSATDRSNVSAQHRRTTLAPGFCESVADSYIGGSVR
jgi:predicted enzyme related to lactoylglutathione lyase